MSIPFGGALACASSWPRLLREGLWLPSHESGSLRGRGCLPLARSLCRQRALGGVRLAGAGKTGTVFGAAERAQCVPSVTHPGRGAAASRRGEQRSAAQEGPAARGKVATWISLAWSGGRRARGRREAGRWCFQGWRDLREPCITPGCLQGVRDENGKGAVEAGSACTHHCTFM